MSAPITRCGISHPCRSVARARSSRSAARICQRDDGTFSREDFIYDEERDIYTCPAGKTMTTTGHVSTDHALRYLASVPECRACPLKPKCCPNMPARRRHVLA